MKLRIIVKCVTGLSLALLLSFCANSQKQITPLLVGSPCEGCEGVLEYGDKALSPVDTLPDFGDDGPKIKVTGTIYQIDGAPAKDVILYIYHTNQQGIYPTKGTETGWANATAS